MNKMRPSTATIVGTILILSVVYQTNCSTNTSTTTRKVGSRNNIVGSIDSGVNNAQRKSCSFVNGLYTNLIRFITKEGFHRDLGDTLEVTVTSSSIPITHFVNGECAFVIYSVFTQDVFVDPYEIDRSPALNGNIRVLNNWTDLENPAWLAKSNSSVFVQVKTIQTGNLISSVEVKMPVHFRYQKPMSHSRTKYRGVRSDELVNSGGFHPVNLPLPKILLRCSYWNAKLVQDQCDTIKLICGLKSPKSKECTWAILPFNANSKGSTVFIPIGDSDHQNLITNTTFLVILGGTIFLLVTLIRAHKENLVVKSHSN